LFEVPITRELRLKQIQNYIFRMPSLSTTVSKVMEICNSPDTSSNDLNRVISLDPVLTGRVLKLINSAYYSLANRTTSLTWAIVMLGLNTVKNLALSTSVLESIGGEESFQALSMDNFWMHSICVGVAAKSMATIKHVPIRDREEYFVAGLLHDLGKIPLNNRFPEEYVNAMELAEVQQVPLYQAENSIFEVDHCMVGGMIAEKWRLSKTITDSLCHHHKLVKVRKENRQLVAIVALANTYANFLKVGSSGDSFPEAPQASHLLEEVGISWSALLDLRETVLSEIEKAKIFLQLTQKG
jgi:putative nucleotidyltransferase with HDIG domain